MQAYAELGAVCSVTIAVKTWTGCFADHAPATAAVAVLKDYASSEISMLAFGC